MLRVRIAPLPDGLHTETLEPAPDDLDLPDAEVSRVTFSDLTVEVQLVVATRQIVARFEVAATAHLICDRTDEPFEQPVRGAHSVVIVAPEAHLAAADDEDVIVTPDDAQFADLTAPVRDTLMLAVPVRRVCPAAETIEIPTAFGEPDTPSDGRWAALAALRDGASTDGDSADGDS